MNILDKILETKRTEVAEAMAVKPFEAIYEKAKAIGRETLSFSGALRTSDSGIVAEFKRRSPSKGFIKEGADVVDIVRGYSLGGATAISVLTDANYFGGALGDLAAAREVASVPLLRKDFIIDPYQICEARIAGADVILLIAAALTPPKCEELAAFASSLGLEVLLEIHNEAELGHMNRYVDVVGVNNRNLATFETDTAISYGLADAVPDTFVKISESGISSCNTVMGMRRVGFKGFLMGENFMKQSDPGTALVEFINGLRL